MMKFDATIRGCVGMAVALIGLTSGVVRADYIAYSGSTVGGPTFNRPIGNGLAAPTDLSGVGTAVAYSTRTFTVAASGVYDISSVANYDNYTVLYQGAFNPASPLTNARLANDDDNGFLGYSGMLGVTLNAGQSYSLVTTGFSNTDTGSFENAIAQSSVFQTGTTAGGPTVDLFGDGQAIRYSLFGFQVSVSGRYSFLSTAAYDNFTVLYGPGGFNPNDVNANLIDFNDDADAIGRSGFLAEDLLAGQSYYFLTAGFDETSFGTFSNSISGPGAIVTNAVPEPTSFGLAGSGLLLAIGLRRRRRPTIA